MLMGGWREEKMALGHLTGHRRCLALLCFSVDVSQAGKDACPTGTTRVAWNYVVNSEVLVWNRDVQNCQLLCYVPLKLASECVFLKREREIEEDEEKRKREDAERNAEKSLSGPVWTCKLTVQGHRELKQMMV
ncbi:hypothetical protein BJY00DRAFT_143437 [Aspergillus carlsbadensis]|nr:hypothetical protein BJY00DRAFT_143437 [Aspergillus carlsbadensis]